MPGKVSRSRVRWLATVIFGFGLLANNAMAVAAGKLDNGSQNNPWLQEHLFNANSQFPFSFVYGRQASESLLKVWTKKIETKQLDSERTEYTAVWSDPKTGLKVRLRSVGYANSAVVEWTAYFTNGGKTDTPILEDIQPLDMSVPLTGNGVPTILYSRGCGGMDTYALREATLEPT